jgi:excisionase family DNA binding protein
MSETPNPFDLFLDRIREVIREELWAAGITSGNGHPKPLTAEELAEILQVDKATIYEWVKAKPPKIPYLKVGRFLRFNLHAVLDSQKKNENPS